MGGCCPNSLAIGKIPEGHPSDSKHFRRHVSVISIREKLEKGAGTDASSLTGKPMHASGILSMCETHNQHRDNASVKRLRGEGHAIGHRGKSSAGMPWRDMPEYNNS